MSRPPRRNAGPWWVTEVLVPTLIVLALVAAYGLAGYVIGP